MNERVSRQRLIRHDSVIKDKLRAHKKLDSYEQDVPAMVEEILESRDRLMALEGERDELLDMRDCVAQLLELLKPYYWHSDDEELEAVNRLRRMLGWREQLGKDEGEAESRADEAESVAAAVFPLPATRKQLNYLESLLEDCFEEYGGGVKGWEGWTGTRLSELTKAEASEEISRWSGRAV